MINVPPSPNGNSVREASVLTAPTSPVEKLYIYRKGEPNRPSPPPPPTPLGPTLFFLRDLLPFPPSQAVAHARPGFPRLLGGGLGALLQAANGLRVGRRAVRDGALGLDGLLAVRRQLGLPVAPPGRLLAQRVPLVAVQVAVGGLCSEARCQQHSMQDGSLWWFVRLCLSAREREKTVRDDGDKEEGGYGVGTCAQRSIKCS